MADPDSFRSTLSGLALGTAMAAAARDYQKEFLAKEEHLSSSADEAFNLDELMNDPDIEKLHADRIAAFKREAQKRQELEKQGHGEYREITECEFLGEVGQSKSVICHFFHREFHRCKIMDMHLKSLAPRHFETKFIKLDAELAPFFVSKLAINTLPCVIFFRKGIAGKRLIGFKDLGGKDDFATKKLEKLLIKEGIILGKFNEDLEDAPSGSRAVRRSSAMYNSDSD